MSVTLRPHTTETTQGSLVRGAGPGPAAMAEEQADAMQENRHPDGSSHQSPFCVSGTLAMTSLLSSLEGAGV